MNGESPSAQLTHSAQLKDSIDKELERLMNEGSGVAHNKVVRRAQLQQLTEECKAVQASKQVLELECKVLYSTPHL